MMNKWKKLMATVCTASLILTMPGMSVPANEVPEQELIADAEVPEETLDSPSENDTDSTDVIVEKAAAEEVVGQGVIQV